MKISVVIQRYGAEVVGGAEWHCRQLVRRLAERHTVEVLTSCALDYTTWRNELPAGRGDDAGIPVTRFPVTEPRDIESFNRFSDRLFGTGRDGAGLGTESGNVPRTEDGDSRASPDPETDREWIRQQGPNCPELLETIEERREMSDVFLFYTYLYYPSVFGLPRVADRAVLVPTAHDEPPLRLAPVREMFDQAAGFLFLTPEERELVLEETQLAGRPETVVGTGIEHPDREALEPRIMQLEYGLQHDYLVYVGRVDAGKGTHELIEQLGRIRDDLPRPLGLVLVGKEVTPIPDIPWIMHLSGISDPDKMSIMAGSLAVVSPSRMESLSLTTLEGWATGRPALVTARSPVLVGHCRRGNGGLYYADTDELLECLNRLMGSPELATTLGRQGQRYVRTNFRWDLVLDRTDEVLGAVASRRGSERR